MNIMDYLPLANVLMGNGLIAGVMVWAKPVRAGGMLVTCPVLSG